MGRQDTPTALLTYNVNGLWFLVGHQVMLVHLRVRRESMKSWESGISQHVRIGMSSGCR